MNIKELAEQAGLKKATSLSGLVGDYIWGTPNELGRFAKLVAAAERESCVGNANQTIQALFDLTEALNDALIEVCSINPKVEIRRKHDQRIKNATAKIKELT